MPYESQKRLAAMRWWRQLNSNAKQFITDHHYSQQRTHDSLTGSEIEKIHSKSSRGVLKNGNFGVQVNFHFVDDDMIAYQDPKSDVEKVFIVEYQRLVLVF